MKTFKNENGYALLMVMMLILLFTVLGMGLMATNMNSATQFNTKEEQVKARHQAEMGVLHYGVLLEDKIKESTATAITCSDIEKLLGTSKKLSKDKYYIEPANGTSSCKEIENKKLLEISVKSTGLIDGNTEKEVEATFYAKNTGDTVQNPITTAPQPELPLKNDGTIDESRIIRNLGKDCKGNSDNCDYEIYTTDKFLILDELITQKHTFHFKDNLEVKSLIIRGGNSDSIKINKDLFVSDILDIQNHACLAIGGNLVVANKILNKNKEKTDIYVYGDFYAPKVQVGIFNFNFFVRGTVYSYDSTRKEYRTIDKAELGIQNLTENISKGCDVAPYDNPKETNKKPSWKLSDEKIIDYQ